MLHYTMLLIIDSESKILPIRVYMELKSVFDMILETRMSFSIFLLFQNLLTFRHTNFVT